MECGWGRARLAANPDIFSPQPQTKSVGLASVFQVLGGVAGPPWIVTCDAEAICAPFMLHSSIAPLVLRNRMSEVPFPLKSPICAICQDASSDTGLPPKVTCCALVIFDPFIVQSMSEPLVLRHKMSELPSPLKSPIPAMLQLESGVTAEPPSVSVWLEVICDPFIVQSISEPLLLRQRMSDLLSPLKSPIPATLQELSGVAALPPKVTC